jgi:L-alanine-DL-glutamate epimerase-like enolase superfamily enzyme
VPGTEGFDPHNRALSNRAIDHMVSLIGAVYDAVGKDTDIAVDCHWRYNASDVVKWRANSNHSGCCGWRIRFHPATLPR